MDLWSCEVADLLMYDVVELCMCILVEWGSCGTVYA